MPSLDLSSSFVSFQESVSMEGEEADHHLESSQSSGGVDGPESNDGSIFVNFK